MAERFSTGIALKALLLKSARAEEYHSTSKNIEGIHDFKQPSGIECID